MHPHSYQFQLPKEDSMHYDDVIMSTMASQITSLTVVYPTVYSDADQRKHQTPASLAFVWGIHRDRWIPRTKGQLRGKCFHLMTSSWSLSYTKVTDRFYIAEMGIEVEIFTSQVIKQVREIDHFNRIGMHNITKAKYSIKNCVPILWHAPYASLLSLGHMTPHCHYY